MKGFIINLEKETLENQNYRQVLYTSHHSQLVLMSLKPGEEIGEEVHDLDQFIRLEQGRAKVILDGVETEMTKDWAVVIPAGARHNVINTSSDEELKLYSVYSPPEHKDGTTHQTKADEKEEHFDGHTTE
ncbi:MAG: cupin domain-containing protein [Patescibacteria group bacterium]|jgi:mannose-6-phosphate isomerase-like protein (cupin superfamily)|nr:cupin domain-containing protein [Patescibacteria group bacterium]